MHGALVMHGAALSAHESYKVVDELKDPNPSSKRQDLEWYIPMFSLMLSCYVKLLHLLELFLKFVYKFAFEWAQSGYDHN